MRLLCCSMHFRVFFDGRELPWNKIVELPLSSSRVIVQKLFEKPLIRELKQT